MDTCHSRCYLEVQVVKQFTTTLLIPLAFSSLKKREEEWTSKPKSKQQQPNKASGKKSLKFFKQIKPLSEKLAKNKVCRKHLFSKWIWTVDCQKHRSIYIVWENNIWNLSFGEPAFKDLGLTLPLISFGSYRSKDKSHTSDSYCIIRNLWGKLRQTVWIVKPCTKGNMRNFSLLQYTFLGFQTSSGSAFCSA